MRITRVLAATAVTAGLLVAGAGAASAGSVYHYYYVGPFTDQAVCDAESTQAHHPEWGTWTHACQYITTGMNEGWYYWVAQNVD